MDDGDTLPEDICDAFGIEATEAVADTDIARVWRVLRGEEVCALKVYRERDMRNEAAGVTWLRDQSGRGAVEILDTCPGAVLMEWLDGPTLGDLVRRARDAEATAILGRLARSVHQSAPSRGSYPALGAWFSDLFDVTFDLACTTELRKNIGRAQLIAKDLLATQGPCRPLHGDLHHDNVKHGARGWCVFDAKGVLGEPAYELANAFRNPVGADALMRDPAVIGRRASVWSDHLGVDRKRLVRWAAAQSALSIAWRAKPSIGSDPDADLLALLLAQTDLD